MRLVAVTSVSTLVEWDTRFISIALFEAGRAREIEF